MPFQKFFLFPAAIFLLFTACSLKYENSSNAENTVPEIISEVAVFSSVEDEKKLFSVKTEKMEQYQGSSRSCSKKLDFEFFNKDGILQAQGRCDFLYADENTGEYILCGNIKIEQTDNEITIFSESLKWNEQSQRLYGQKNEKVTLTKKNLTVEGTGFCASAADNQFSFSGNVHGTLITGEEKEQ